MRGLEKIFRPRDLFVPLTLFVILDILDIPDEFGGKNFFLKKSLDLKLFRENLVTRTFFWVFSY
jgi:hypothetical protein